MISLRTDVCWTIYISSVKQWLIDWFRQKRPPSVGEDPMQLITDRCTLQMNKSYYVRETGDWRFDRLMPVLLHAIRGVLGISRWIWCRSDPVSGWYRRTDWLGLKCTNTYVIVCILRGVGVNCLVWSEKEIELCFLGLLLQRNSSGWQLLLLFPPVRQ